MTKQDLSPTPRRILRKRATAAKVGLSVVTLWRLSRLGKFPQAVKLSDQAVGFYEDEVEAWLASRERVKDEGRPSPNPKAHRRETPDAA